MRAFAIRNVGWWGYDGYVSLYELFVAFGHLSINTKVDIQKNKDNRVRHQCESKLVDANNGM